MFTFFRYLPFSSLNITLQETPCIKQYYCCYFLKSIQILLPHSLSLFNQEIGSYKIDKSLFQLTNLKIFNWRVFLFQYWLHFRMQKFVFIVRKSWCTVSQHRYKRNYLIHKTSTCFFFVFIDTSKLIFFIVITKN